MLFSYHVIFGNEEITFEFNFYLLSFPKMFHCNILGRDHLGRGFPGDHMTVSSDWKVILSVVERLLKWCWLDAIINIILIFQLKCNWQWIIYLTTISSCIFPIQAQEKVLTICKYNITTIENIHMYIFWRQKIFHHVEWVK